MDPRAEIVNRSIFDDCPDIYAEFGKPDICIHLAWRNGFVHNAATHMEDLSGPLSLPSLHDGRAVLKNLAVMGTMHEIGYWKGLLMKTHPAIRCLSTA